MSKFPPIRLSSEYVHCSLGSYLFLSLNQTKRLNEILKLEKDLAQETSNILSIKALYEFF